MTSVFSLRLPFIFCTKMGGLLSHEIIPREGGKGREALVEALVTKRERKNMIRIENEVRMQIRIHIKLQNTA